MPGELSDEREYHEERRERLAHDARRGVSRRRLLQMAAAGVPLIGSLGAAGRAVAGPGDPAPPTPIRKPTPPEWFVDYGTNAEMRWDAVGDLGTRSPTSASSCATTPPRPRSTRPPGGCASRAPRCGRGRWSSPIRTCSRLPSREITAFVECAGNGRSFFAGQQGTPAAGTAWGLGAIGVARWRGVPLSVLLDRARVDRRARWTSCRRASTPPSWRTGRSGPRAPAAVDRQGPGRRARGPRDERRAAAARPRIPGALGGPGVDRGGQHQVARPHPGVRRAAHLVLEHGPVPLRRRRRPGRLPP